MSLILAAFCLTVAPLAALAGISEGIKFSIPQDEQERFMFAPSAFYDLLGPGENAALCIDLQTNGSVSVMVGNCLEGQSLGIFDSGIVAVNKSIVDDAMEQARDVAKTCKRKPVGIHLRAEGGDAKGTIRLFQCTKTVTCTRASEDGDGVVEKTQLEPTVTTWNDVRRNIPFNTIDGEVWVAKVDMGRTINTAIGYEYATVCFSLHGASFAKVSLSKCRYNNDFELDVPSNAVVGISQKERLRLKKLKEDTCGSQTSPTDWYVKIEAMDDEPASGYLSVYSCYEIEGNRFSPNDNYMGMKKTFYISQGPLTDETFSADIQQIFNAATMDDEGKMKVSMLVETTSPLTVSVSRCKGSSANRVILAEDVVSGEIFLENPERFVNLSLQQKCGESESDEALYLHVRTKTEGASGSLKFELAFDEEHEDIDQKTLRTNTFFKVKENSIVSRSLPLGKIFDETLSNKVPLGIRIATGGNLTLTVSKCPEGKRAMLLDNVDDGTHPVGWFNVVAAVNLMARTSCPNKPAREYADVILWIEAHDTAAIGSLQLVSLQINNTKSHLTPYVSLGPKFTSVNSSQVISVKIDLAHGHPLQEVDFRYFVEAALADPNIDLHIEAVHSSEDVPMIFSRCRNATSDDYHMVISKNRHLTKTELIAMRVLMRHPRCDVTTVNGVFIHPYNKKYQRKVSIYLNDIRTEMGKETDMSLSGNREEILTIPFSNTDKALSIHVFNTKDDALKLTLFVCGDRADTWRLSKGRLTVGNFFLSPAEIELRRKIAGCPEEKHVYLSMRSFSASGRLAISRAFCPSSSCESDISVNFFTN